MATNGNPHTDQYWNGDRPLYDSFETWLESKGKDAYKDFKKGHPTTKLSYEGWRQSDQVYGGYIFYVASLVWNEDGDSDDEPTKRRRIVRVPDHDPNKTATTNGNAAPRNAGSATPTPVANSEELNASGKRKRKPRKKYMSQELVASDEEPADDGEAATHDTEVATSATPAVTVNGRRKSGSRKPRKKPISDETISPEDENDDPMEVDAPVTASPLPVRSAPRAATAARHTESPKKATPKQSSVKKSRKSFLSEEMVLDEDTDNGDASIAEVSRPATTPAKSKPSTSNSTKTDTTVDEAAETAIAKGTLDSAASNTRRGLRNRKPAQQRPYYHDAQLFEDAETEPEEDTRNSSPSETSTPPPPDDDVTMGLWDALLQESQELYKKPTPDRQTTTEKDDELDESEPEPEPEPSRPKHFKGKGRAWKKEGSDEDEEFTPKQKKAAKAAKTKADKAKAKADKAAEKTATDDTPKQRKKIGRPRKSNLSEDIVRDDSDNDTSMLDGEPTPQATPSQPPKRGRGRPRKSALSSEIVRDESDDELPPPASSKQTAAPSSQKEKDPEPEALDLTTPPKRNASRPSTATSTTQTLTPKKRGRPRKSSNVTPAKSSAKANADKENEDAKGYISTTARRGSTTEAAEPKTTRARASISSAPEVPAPAAASEAAPTPVPDHEYAMPSINRGAALIESLYPREPLRQPSRSASVSNGRAASVSTPAPMAPSMLPVAAQAQSEPPVKPSVEEQIKEVEAEAKKEVEAEVKAAAAAAAEAKAEAHVEKTVEEEKSDEPNEKENVQLEAWAKNGEERDEDRDREMSASMSLSSDSEL